MYSGTVVTLTDCDPDIGVRPFCSPRLLISFFQGRLLNLGYVLLCMNLTNK